MLSRDTSSELGSAKVVGASPASLSPTVRDTVGGEGEMGKGLCANSSGLTHRELVCGAGLHSCLRFRRAVDVLLTHSRPTAISRFHSDQATEHS